MSHPTVTAEPPDAERVVAPRWPGAAPSVSPQPLVGRERDLAALRKLARGREPAFVTLVGVGGVGKSRLAAELAIRASRSRERPGRERPAGCGQRRVARAAGHRRGARDRRRARRVRRRTPCRTRSAPRPRSSSWTPSSTSGPPRRPWPTSAPGRPASRSSPRAASRSACRASGSCGWSRWPSPRAATDDAAIEALLDSPAAQLFLERARAVRPDFEVTPANAALIAAICRRLDGLPLAIELAAAALRVLAPHQLLDQLADPLVDVGVGSRPTGSGRRGPARQRSLRAAMDWSIGLLGERCCGCTAAWA